MPWMSSFLLAGASMFALSSAYALDVTLKQDGESLVLDIPAGQGGLSVFKRFDDLWIVSNRTGDPLTLKAGDDIRQKAGLRAVEALQVTGGEGLRLNFKKFDTATFAPDGTSGYRLELGGVGTPSTATLAIGPAPKGVVVNSDGVVGAVRATSMETRESYVTVTVNTPQAIRAERVEAGVLALPTYLGGAFVAAEGVPLAIEKATGGVALVPMQDAPSVASARANRRKVESDFINQLLSEVGQKGVSSTPVPSATRPPVPEFMPRPVTGRFENAYESLNQALMAIENIDGAQGAPTAPKSAEGLPKLQGLGTVPIASDEVIDLSGIQPGEASARLTMPHSSHTADLTAPQTEETQPQVLANQTGTDANTATYEGPTALPENTFLPNFGERGKRDFYELVTRFRNRIMTDPSPEEQLKARARLTKLLFFNNRFYETLGMLQTMPQDPKTRLPRDRDARLLYGATLTQLGRPADALKVFATDDAPTNDRLVWEAAALGATGQHDKAVALFDKHIDYTKQYPKHVQQHLRYAYALSLFQLERFGKMTDQIDYLASLGGDDNVLAYAQLLMARTYIARNQDVIAEQILVNLANHHNQIVANHALLEYINLLLKRGDISEDQAIMHFENLRYIWRGDEVEKESLLQLGDLYLKTERPREALETLKYLTVVFPGTESAEAAAKTMVNAFSDLYLKGMADKVLPPLDILGVYYDFRELTPPGEDGDKVVENVVDRLARVGLYERAIEVMKTQMRYRIKDAMARAKAGALLAHLHYLHYNADEGLKVLLQTTAPDMPQELVDKRNTTRVNLLSLAGRHEDALKVAQQLPATKPNDYLRADIAFRAEDYQAVVKNLKPHLIDKRLAWWQHEDTMAFNRLAMSLSVQGAAETLEKLQEQYADNIAEQDMVNEINFLTQNAGSVKMPKGVKGVITNRHKIWNSLYAQVAKYNQFADKYDALYRAREDERRLPDPTEGF